MGHDPYRSPSASPAPLVGSGAPPDAGVPAGTSAEVLAWVGSDPSRAAQALAVEQERPNPRKTLLGSLSALL